MSAPHDPSNPNDSRNWNGHPGPTFRAVDPYDVQRNTIVYSSFTLLPIPAHLLPPHQAPVQISIETPNPTYQGPKPIVQLDVALAPREELENRLAELDPELPVPPGLIVNIHFAGLDRQVRYQNPDSFAEPTCGQLLTEIRRQNALIGFHQKHLQLLPDLTRYLEKDGDAANTFAGRPELNELAQQIANFVRKGSKEVYSVQVQAEVQLRIREGSSQDTTDSNIFQLQHLWSQVYRQIEGEEVGITDIPKEITEDLLYQQVRAYLASIKRGSNNSTVCSDIKRRITKLRSQRFLELNPELNSQPSSRAPSQVPGPSRTKKPVPKPAPTPSFTPEVIPDVTSQEASQDGDAPPAIRGDVLNYGMQIESGAGLPAGFAFDPKWAEGGRAGAAANVQTLRYYVNDGPQGPQEIDGEFFRRVKRAVENMGIERRVLPFLNAQRVLNFGKDKKGLTRARKDIKNKYYRDTTQHNTSLKNSLKYRAKWAADKRARQAKNAVRRREAQETLRAELASRPESLGMRLPTPPPPDDSGDELYDFSITQGPRVVESQTVRLRKGRDRKEYRERSQPGPEPEDVPILSENELKCTGCFVASVECSMALTGRPCNRCQSLRIHCLGRDEEIGFKFINRRTALPLSEAERGSVAARKTVYGQTFQNSYPTDKRFTDDRGRTTVKSLSRKLYRAGDRRSRSPTGENDSDFGHIDFPPCDNCIVNGRSCDGQGPPCTPCVLNGVEATCDVIGFNGQLYQPQSPMMSYSPAQLNYTPEIGAPALDPWSRVNALVEDGVPLTSGAELNPFQAIPPTPQGPIDWEGLDAIVWFNNNDTANPSAEMEAQSMNWVSSEPAIPLGELQYNAFGQELDMHGAVIPNGRIQNYVPELDSGFPVNSAENGYSSGTTLNADTEYDQFAVNNYFDPNAELPNDFFSMIDDLNDTTMGGTSDEPLNPQLPNDALSFGQDPSRQPDYTLVESPVFPNIDPLSTRQKIPAQNSEPCEEDPEYFNNWTGATCRWVPSKSCDHSSHVEPYAICIKCHDLQNAAFSAMQEELISSTKRYMCTPCSHNARSLYLTGTPVNPDKDPNEKVLFAMCLCTAQMRKTWLCHLHRDQALTRVKARVAIAQDVVVRASGLGGVKCPFCLVREQDTECRAWACVACYSNVIAE